MRTGSVAGIRRWAGAVDRASWTLVWLVALGLTVVGLLIVVERIAEHHVAAYAPAVAAASGVRVSIATSHLWLEEYLSGDGGVSVEQDVLHPMEEAEALTAALLHGGPVGNHAPAPPLAEPSLHRRVEEIDRQLDRFRALATTRVEQRTGAGVGSPLDQRYDQVFRGLLDDVGELEAEIAERMMAGRRRARLLFGAILAAWAGLVVGAVVTLRRRERRHRRAEALLDERETQLAEAQKLEAVGRLAGGLAHDVNNYMAAIQAQCGVIRLKRGDDAELAGMLDEIGDTVGRVAGLLERLLAFSRSRPLAPQVIDLNEMAREMGGMMQRLLGDDVRLDMRLAEDLWASEVDPAEVEQVLVNLLVNAREAMPTGGRVRLATANRRVPGAGIGGQAEWVVLSVADEGEGIPDEVRERIFEPFFSTKRGSGHSGLGLATVYGVARRAGGFVTVESTPGAGARFDLHLPRARRAAEPRPPRRRDVLPAATARANLLLVEDNAALAVASAAFLSELGHRVVREGDGLRALRRLDGPEDFDLVITDLVLPGASGQEIAARALALGLPVVVVSAFPDRVDLEDLVARPEVRFLAKPYSPEDLVATLTDVLAAYPRRLPAATR